MKLSIIIPVYNGEKTIGKTLESVCYQKLNDFEVIVVNDGSTDKTLEIVNNYIESQSLHNVRVVTKNNAGLPRARKTGILYATGEYVGFVDADDWVEDDMYFQLLSSAERHNADVACCNIVFYYSNTKRVMTQKLESDKVLSANEAMHALNCRLGIFSSYCNKIIRRTLFKGVLYPKFNMSNEDYMVMIQILPRANGIVPIGFNGYHYVQCSGSMIRNGYGKTDEYGYYCMKRILYDVYKNKSKIEKKEIDTYMVDFFLFLIADMGINHYYDIDKIQWIRSYYKRRIIGILFNSNHTFLCKVSVISVCINHKFFIIAYNLYRSIVEKWSLTD